MSKRRLLGQHMLIDNDVLRKMLDCIELKKDDVVFEIGTGNGNLTAELCKRAKRVVSCEIDKELGRKAQDTLGKYSNLLLVVGDGFKAERRDTTGPGCIGGQIGHHSGVDDAAKRVDIRVEPDSSISEIHNLRVTASAERDEGAFAGEGRAVGRDRAHDTLGSDEEVFPNLQVRREMGRGVRDVDAFGHAHARRTERRPDRCEDEPVGDGATGGDGVRC